MFYNPIRKTDVPRLQQQPRSGWQRHCFKHTHTHKNLLHLVFMPSNIFIPGFHCLYSICFHIPCRINGFKSDQVNIGGFLVKPFHHFQSCTFDDETSAAVKAARAQTKCNREFTSRLMSVSAADHPRYGANYQIIDEPYKKHGDFMLICL